MYTLENDRCDCIRKENGEWGFFRSGGKTEFETYDEVRAAYLEIKQQYKHITDIVIAKW